MMTRQLLLGFFLGLLAAVHSSPLGAVFNEAKTEGFLVNEQTGPSFSSEPFKTNTTSQAPQLSDAEGLGVRSEGSGQNLIGTSAVPTQDSSLTIESDEAPETPGTPQTTQWPQLEDSGEIPPSERSEGSEQNPSGTSAVPTQDSSLTIESDEVPETPGTPQTTQGPHLEIKKSPILSGERPLEKRITDNRHLKSPEGKSTSKTTHSRADWLIILGIAVGIVALLGLCVAVATRDKWNKDSSSSSVEKSNLLNQEREQEMQTFLHKNKPKENGQIGEYTVIPLNDIPEKY